MPAPRSRPRASMSPGCSRLPAEATGVALILVDADGENSIAVAGGANAALDLGAGPGRAQASRADAARTSCWSATRSGPAPRTRRSGSAGSPARRRSSTPPRRRASSRPTLALADMLTPNRGRAGGPRRRGRPGERAGQAPARPGARAVARRLVSLGADGALLVTARRPRAINAPHVDAVDTVGAGDTLNGALAAALAAGLRPLRCGSPRRRRCVAGGHPGGRPRGDADAGRARGAWRWPAESSAGQP